MQADIEHALEDAGLVLGRDDCGLYLTDGTMTLHADFQHMLGRIRPNALPRELLVRAAKVKGSRGKNEHPIALDATAGLGEDSLLLAAAGFEVQLYERNPIIAALLRDAVERALNDDANEALREAATRMRVFEGDSIAALGRLGSAPDVILLDPMFPAKQKSSSVKKKLQLLQKLERPCDDEAAMLETALRVRPRKVVVKRPAKGPHLAGRKPSYSIAGKAVRYDCYV